MNQPTLTTEQAVALAASLPKSNHRQTKTNAQGFVRLLADDEPRGFLTREKQFFGLMAPGNHVACGDLMTRALITANNAPAWFHEYLKTLKDTNTWIRMSIVGISYKAPVAFVIPKAANLNQLQLENKRHLDSLVNHQKYGIDEFPDAGTLANFVYDAYAKKYNGLIVRRHWSEQGRYAIMIMPGGGILKLTGGENVWNFTGGIACGHTTLDKEVELAVKARRIYSI